MAQIPSKINGVELEFAPTVDNDAIPMLVDGLKHTISSNLSSDFPLARLWISSVRDSHTCPSRHVTGNAVDISRVNGKFIATYTTDIEVSTLVSALQQRFETYLPHRRENFGPSLKLKLGMPFNVSGHNDHIHLSVSGPHPCPTLRWYERIFRIWKWLRWNTSPQPEVCRPDEGD